MRRFVLIAALTLACASAQAGGTRGLSSGGTPNDPPAVNTQAKPGVQSAQSDGAPVVPATAPPPAVETPRYAPPPSEAAKPADTTRKADTPVQIPVQTPVQTPAASREARDRHGRVRHANYYGSGWSGYGWDYGHPYVRTRHWSTRRIIAALHRYGLYW